MRKLLMLLMAVAFTASTFSQAPQKMSYQAVVRNSSSQLVTNQMVGMKISILQGSPEGNVVYTQTLSPSTNANGLVSVEIGGEPGFASIDWSVGDYFIQTETDPDGGDNYSITGTSQLLSVPYALYAQSAATANYDSLSNKPTLFTGNYEDLSNKPSLSDSIKSQAVLLSGDQTISGDKIFTGTTTVAAPVNAYDAATKQYVDALLEELKEMQAELGVSDIEGNHYNAVKIGSQIWMKENLRTTTYRNGDAIGTTTPATLDISGESEPKYQWAYGGDEGNAATLGRLYTWYAVTDSRHLCPDGWHVPSDEEWAALSDHLTSNGYGYEGSGGDIAKSMAARSSWVPNEVLGTPGNHLPSNNSSNFNALSAGLRNFTGPFDYQGTQALWWSSSEVSEVHGSNRIIYSGLNFLHRGIDLEKHYGFSVRCIKDASTTPSSDRHGLYTIKTGTDELYFIDLETYCFTKVANIGLVASNMFFGLQYKDDKLYIVNGGKLYTYDIASGLLTEHMTNPNLQWQFSINSAGELYSVTEVSGLAQGSMYRIDTALNTSTLIGTTGTPSLWGMGFDSSDQLWAVDEFYQKFGTMNTSTGTFTATSSKNSYTDTYYAIPDDKGNLYSFNVGTPSGIVKYKISDDTAELILPLAVNWAGLAYGIYKSY
jgi:uncharacterized protein (TIGR02145 family)